MLLAITSTLKLSFAKIMIRPVFSGPVTYTHVQMLNRWPFHGYIEMAQMDLKHLTIHL